MRLEDIRTSGQFIIAVESMDLDIPGINLWAAVGWNGATTLTLYTADKGTGDYVRQCHGTVPVAGMVTAQDAWDAALTLICDHFGIAGEES